MQYLEGTMSNSIVKPQFVGLQAISEYFPVYSSITLLLDVINTQTASQLYLSCQVKSIRVTKEDIEMQYRICNNR